MNPWKKMSFLCLAVHRHRTSPWTHDVYFRSLISCTVPSTSQNITKRLSQNHLNQGQSGWTSLWALHWTRKAASIPQTVGESQKKSRIVFPLKPPFVVDFQVQCFIYMGMDQYLLIPFLGEWTSMNPSYFDVNYRGTIGFDTLPYS